jgi:polyhydroxybutyrate depolymerase
LLRRAFHIPGGELIIAYGNWDRMAEARGFLVAAPDSRGHAFSDGSGRGGADVKSIDDSAFIDSVIDDMKRRYAIDARRIYLVGLSSGGSMAQTMAIERPGKIAAFAAVMGHLWTNDQPPAPTRPMLLLFGDSDKLNPMNGGAVKYHPIIGVTLDKPGPNQTAELWSKRMGCGDSSMPDEGPAVDVTFWPSCRDGSELMLFIVRNLAHHWPGGAKPSDKAIKAIGPYTDAVDATELIWDFFSQHRRR